jgi:hypothetical protein
VSGTRFKIRYHEFELMKSSFPNPNQIQQGSVIATPFIEEVPKENGGRNHKAIDQHDLQRRGTERRIQFYHSVEDFIGAR